MPPFLFHSTPQLFANFSSPRSPPSLLPLRSHGSNRSFHTYRLLPPPTAPSYSPIQVFTIDSESDEIIERWTWDVSYDGGETSIECSSTKDGDKDGAKKSGRGNKTSTNKSDVNLRETKRTMRQPARPSNHPTILPPHLIYGCTHHTLHSFVELCSPLTP